MDHTCHRRRTQRVRCPGAALAAALVLGLAGISMHLGRPALGQVNGPLKGRIEENAVAHDPYAQSKERLRDIEKALRELDKEFRAEAEAAVAAARAALEKFITTREEAKDAWDEYLTTPDGPAQRKAHERADEIARASNTLQDKWIEAASKAGAAIADAATKQKLARERAARKEAIRRNDEANKPDSPTRDAPDGADTPGGPGRPGSKYPAEELTGPVLDELESALDEAKKRQRGAEGQMDPPSRDDATKSLDKVKDALDRGRDAARKLKPLRDRLEQAGQSDPRAAEQYREQMDRVAEAKAKAEQALAEHARKLDTTILTKIVHCQDLARFVFAGYNTGKPIRVAAVKNMPGTYLLALSGTEPANLAQCTHLPEDIAAAANLPDGLQLALHNALSQSVPANSQLVMAGHSLGGMELENLAADPRFSKAGYKVKALITFGSPQTTGVRSPIRFTTLGDPVPYLTPRGATGIDRAPHIVVDGGEAFTRALLPKGLGELAQMSRPDPTRLLVAGVAAHMAYPDSKELWYFDALGRDARMGDPRRTVLELDKVQSFAAARW